jgi:serine phosphatase RsbU (regulator of sigma subunit)
MGMASLTGLKGVNQGVRLTLEGEKVVIGRNADCQIIINVPAVSREHALIRHVQGKWAIEDLKSRNGTFVNSQEVTSRVVLKDGDKIKICDNVYQFCEGAPGGPGDVTGEMVSALFGPAAEGEQVVEVLRAGPTEEDCRQVRRLLERSHVFYMQADSRGLQQQLQAAESRARQALGQGFHRLVVFDARQGLDPATGFFSLEAFLGHVRDQLVTVFGLHRTAHGQHDQDIAQCLKDEARSLFCFLNVQHVPVRDLRRLRGFTQGRHQALFVCCGLRDLAAEEEEIDDVSSSASGATLSQPGKRILETQPAEKLALLLEITADLTQTFEQGKLLPKIVDSLFHVFRQADRGFIILSEEGTNKLVPTVIKTRHPADETSARFSRRIVNRCLETGEALLSEDASADKRFDLSQSIADCRIRSVMCAPLLGRGSGKAFGVLQLDTQDRSKRFSQDDLKLLLAVAGQAAIALENARMHETLVTRAGLERDLRTAEKVQHSFLPKKAPAITGYEFFAEYAAAQEVGGDYYDFIPMPGGRLAVMVGDVAGKGVPAALLMARLCRDACFCLLSEPDLALAMTRLNERMQDAGMQDRFVSLLAAVLDPASHQVTFVNAGHAPPLLYRRSAGKLLEGAPRDRAGFPLGVAEGIPYEASAVQLAPGDVIVLYTEGCVQARDKNDQEFGPDRMVAALQADPAGPRAMGTRLVNAVKQFAQGRKPHDDLTVVAFGRTV